MTTAQDFLSAIQAGDEAEVARLLDIDPALANAADENG